MEEKTLRERINFLMLIGSAFHRYGASADTIESALNQLSLKLGLSSSVFSLPTSLSASFKFSDDYEEARMERLEPGKINLSKLHAVDHVIDEVLTENLTIRAGRDHIRKIIEQKVLFPYALVGLSHAVIAASVCLLFGGNTIDMIFSLFLGMLVGFVTESVRKERLDSVIDVFLAFSISFVSLIPLKAGLAVHPQVISISALIILVPGLTLTTALRELSSQNLTSGTARLLGGIMILLKLAVGIYLGQTAMGDMKEMGLKWTQNYLSGNLVASLGLIGVTALGFMVCFQARPRDYLWITLGCLTSYLCVFFLEPLMGQVGAIFCAGTLLASCSNLYAHAQKAPALVFLLPSIILLVPGTLGQKALNLIFYHEFELGLRLFFSMVLIGIALASGILFGSAIIKPKRFL